MTKPMPGRAYIELDSFYRQVEGCIIITDGTFNRLAMDKKCRCGTVTALSLYPEGRKMLVVVRSRNGTEKLAPKEAFRWNSIYKDIEGKKVIVEDGVGTVIEYDDKEFLNIRLEHIVAILPDGEIVKPVDSEVPRCPRCKSHGIPNILMVKMKGKMVCPKCNMTAEGKQLKDIELESDVKLDELQSPEKRTIKGTVYSYDGQGKRS